MKWSVLASSSSGNCTYLVNKNKRYLIDCGISLRRIRNAVLAVDIPLDYIDAIFITHEHSDHVNSLDKVLNSYRCPVYMTKKTYAGLSSKIKENSSPIQFRFISNNETFIVDDLCVTSFPTSHDVNDPIGYIFKDQNDKSLCYLTDTGVFDNFDLIKNMNTYILESNHNTDMLLMSSRPYELKNRIISKYGHLSNEMSAEIFSKVRGNNTNTLCLYHLSSECNSKEQALLDYESYFRKNNLSFGSLNLYISDKDNPMEMVEVK